HPFLLLPKTAENHRCWRRGLRRRRGKRRRRRQRGRRRGLRAGRRRRCLEMPVAVLEERRNRPSKKEDIDARSARKTTTPAAKRRKFLRNFAR
ncbi:unnamed protein product, partial [Linum tenue]